jgi:hypothetical protein
MQHLEVSGAVRPIYGSLVVRRLIFHFSVSIYLERCSVIFYTAWCGVYVATFRDKLRVPPSVVKQSKRNALSRKGLVFLYCNVCVFRIE